MKTSILMSVVFLAAGIAQADMISIQCGGEGDKAKLAFSSMTTEPTRADFENLALDYKGKEIQLASIQTNKANDQIVSYEMKQVAPRRGFDIPHLEFEFKNLQSCGDAEATTKAEVTVRNVGGFAGTLDVETIKDCSCDVD